MLTMTTMDQFHNQKRVNKNVERENIQYIIETLLLDSGEVRFIYCLYNLLRNKLNINGTNTKRRRHLIEII